MTIKEEWVIKSYWNRYFGFWWHSHFLYISSMCLSGNFGICSRNWLPSLMTVKLVQTITCVMWAKSHTVRSNPCWLTECFTAVRKVDCQPCSKAKLSASMVSSSVHLCSSTQASSASNAARNLSEVLHVIDTGQPLAKLATTGPISFSLTLLMITETIFHYNSRKIKQASVWLKVSTVGAPLKRKLLGRLTIC